MQAIRAKCLDCCNQVREEVKLCTCLDCSLYPYRFGTTENQVENKKKARRKYKEKTNK